MKPFILFLTFFCFVQMSFAQHSYSNPRSKEKKMLLEEKEESVSQEEAFVKDDSSQDSGPRMTRGEQKFCACEKMYFLSLKRAKLYNRLVRKDLIKRRFRQRKELADHERKSLAAMKLMRGKYEIERNFECRHENVSHKKISEYTQAISGLTTECDIEIITEVY